MNGVLPDCSDDIPVTYKLIGVVFQDGSLFLRFIQSSAIASEFSSSKIKIISCFDACEHGGPEL